MLNVETEIYLKDLEYSSYLDSKGEINTEFDSKIGIYAIFNQEKKIQYIGYSRNLYMSLKQHLVRKIDDCYWLKIHLIERPNRSTLEKIRNNWLKENESLLINNQEEEKLWTQPIETKQEMTAAEQKEYQQQDELNQIKLLKKVARRVEEEIKQKLNSRGVTMKMRFNPKLKEEGLLDLK